MFVLVLIFQYKICGDGFTHFSLQFTINYLSIILAITPLCLIKQGAVWFDQSKVDIVELICLDEALTLQASACFPT